METSAPPQPGWRSFAYWRGLWSSGASTAVDSGFGILSLVGYVRRAWDFWIDAGLRFWHDELFSKGSSLAFQTTLALVPLLTVVLSVLAGFPGFSGTIERVEDWFLSVLAPQSIEQVRTAFDEMLPRAGKATAIGALALAAVAVMLLRTVGETFDEIFRVQKRRSLPMQLLAYWAFLTLGPLFFAAGLSLTASLFADEEAMLGVLFTRPFNPVKALLPFMIEWIGFAAVYWLMPSRQPWFRDALAAGGVAAVLFQILKIGYGFYLTEFASYDTVYGALAAIPITLLWLELSWIIALFGAVVAALLGERRAAAASTA